MFVVPALLLMFFALSTFKKKILGDEIGMLQETGKGGEKKDEDWPAVVLSMSGKGLQKVC